MGAYGGGHGFDVNTSVQSKENIIPLTYDLKQNYPIPFKPGDKYRVPSSKAGACQVNHL